MGNLIALIPQLLKSRTMIVNIATLVVTVATAVSNVEFIKENPEVTAFLLGTVVPAANMVLRVLTTKSVFDKTTTLKSD